MTSKTVQIQISETIRQFAKSVFARYQAEDYLKNARSRLMKERLPYMKEIRNLDIKKAITKLFNAPPEQVANVRDEVKALNDQKATIVKKMSEDAKIKEATQIVKTAKDNLTNADKTVREYLKNPEIIEIAK
jgi:ElaB/YqjD/DUF883 family membrane-anchored ribosome-binding protein